MILDDKVLKQVQGVQEEAAGFGGEIAQSAIRFPFVIEPVGSGLFFDNLKSFSLVLGFATGWAAVAAGGDSWSAA